MDWINQAHECDNWQAIVNIVMNLWFPRREGISWLAVQLAPFWEEVCSI